SERLSRHRLLSHRAELTDSTRSRRIRPPQPTRVSQAGSLCNSPEGGSLSRNESVFPAEREVPPTRKEQFGNRRYPARDRGFESPSLQRRARSELLPVEVRPTPP